MPTWRDLTPFGLNEAEAKVYLASLKLGPDSVQHIAQVAKLNRVSVYGILEQLVDKGFIQEQQLKNKRKFSAYPPAKLYDLLGREQDRLRKAEQHLNQLVPALKAMAKLGSVATNIIYYEGEEGLKNWASDALETKGELLEWTRIESFSKPFEHYLNSYYFPEKCKRQIPTRFIFLDTPEAHDYVQTRYMDNPKAPPMKARFIALKEYNAPGFSVIYNHRYSIGMPKELRAITVEDPLIADTQRKMWEFGWLHATHEVQNKPYPKIVVN